MKINMKLAVIISVLAIPLAAVAQSEPKVTPVGIRVIKEVLDREGNKLVPFNTFDQGTCLAVKIETGGASIIKFDEQGSVLDSFVDDQGNDLLVKPKGFAKNGFGSFAKISKDGKVMLVEINAAGAPDVKANKVIAKGTAVLQVGEKRKAFKSAPFEPKKGTAVKVGEIEMTVAGAEKPSYGDDALEIKFETSNKAITMLAGVKFFDEMGVELESNSSGSSSMGFNKKYTYGQDYSLRKAVKGKVVVQFEMWTDLAEKKVPFEISAGVGG